MTDSIKVELIPWNTENLYMKTFTWALEVFNEKEMVINILFDHPYYISMGENPDTIKVTFMNTSLFLKPTNN